MSVDSFKQLRVYQAAFRAATELFELSKGWPTSEKYALTDQVRRSSRSVCANIAEAWFKRRYPRHFVSKLSDAGSEAAETLVWIDFAVYCGYLSPDEGDRFEQSYRAISGGLVKMMAKPEQWCVSATDRVREPAVPYETDDILDS